MSRYHAYLETAATLVNDYKGQEPLSSYLKKYFAANRKHGSGDRKAIAHLCYCYFRFGKLHWPSPAGVKERILFGLFLSATTGHPVLTQLKPEWAASVSLPPEAKYALLAGGESDHAGFLLSRFEFMPAFSDGLDPVAFSASLFTQPDLFLRLRPGKEAVVKGKLEKAGFAYTEPLPSCLALANAARLDDVLQPDAEAVIQDYSSQRVGELLRLVPSPHPLRVWDCCAASGGKSLLAADLLPISALLVSDIRESVLANLKKRFAMAGLRNFEGACFDLTKPLKSDPGTFDLVIADVPCTGSGTWGRTPEQAWYFDPQSTRAFHARQSSILRHVLPSLLPGGHLLYITCSVFREENEDITEWLRNEWGLNAVKQRLLTGYGNRADTLFAALLQKPL